MDLARPPALPPSKRKGAKYAPLYFVRLFYEIANGLSGEPSGPRSLPTMPDTPKGTLGTGIDR
jgi:hypothetical protein